MEKYAKVMNNKFKVSGPTWNEEFWIIGIWIHQVMDHIVYQIFKIILHISLKNMGERLLIFQ